VAELRPLDQVPRRTVVTEVPLMAPMESAPVVVQPVGRDRTHLDRGMPMTLQARTVVDPMTATASRMHLTVSPEFVALLKKAKAGQSHVQPGATDVQLLTAALELFIEKQEKRKASVPAKVKREVRKRGQGKCQWPLASGGVCGSTVKGAPRLRRRPHGPIHPACTGGAGSGSGMGPWQTTVIADVFGIESHLPPGRLQSCERRAP
jgi:hypothetical protein